MEISLFIFLKKSDFSYVTLFQICNNKNVMNMLTRGVP